MLRVPLNLALNTFSNWESAAFLGNLFQCLITLAVKNFFPIIKINQRSLNLKLLPLVLPLHTRGMWKLLSSLLVGCLVELEGHNMVTLEPSPLQGEQFQLSDSVTGEVLHPSNNPCGPPPDLIQLIYAFNVGGPRAGCSTHVGSQWPFDAAQGMVATLGCKCSLLGHVPPFTCQRPQVLGRAALHLFLPQPLLVLGVASAQVKHLALSLVK